VVGAILVLFRSGTLLPDDGQRSTVIAERSGLAIHTGSSAQPAYRYPGRPGDGRSDAGEVEGPDALAGRRYQTVTRLASQQGLDGDGLALVLWVTPAGWVGHRIGEKAATFSRIDSRYCVAQLAPLAA